MTEYQATSTSLRSFRVTRNHNEIGKISYDSWFNFTADIETANAHYHVEPHGFWGTSIHVKDGEQLLAKFQMNWSGDIVLNTFFNGRGSVYRFKHKGVLKESFTLTDEQGTELCVVKPSITWTKMNYEYQVTTTDTFEAIANKDLLLLNSIHCANYYVAVMMGGMM